MKTHLDHKLFVLTTLFLALHGDIGQKQTALANAGVSKDSVPPGSSVFAGGKELKLHLGTISVGGDFKPFADLLGIKIGTPMVISVVPSIDTQVCEEQSHIMAESPDLDKLVGRYVVSRDTSMAQLRFQREAKLQNVTFVSDFKNASFGKQSGLLIDDSQLLARAILVVDADGMIRHLQIVKTISDLPDMPSAFKIANSLMSAAPKTKN